MRYDSYLRSMIGRIFKLLPLREQTDMGANMFLDAYIDDLSLDSAGAMETFPELYECPLFVSVVNSLNYMRYHWSDMPFSSYRSTVLRMTNGLSKLLGEEVPND